ncbi:phage virion morphogenesis protein [Antrihabitans sp. YC2-6]|uniref:phage virion morphogenesis protein n=1 Tax=Antrihabitans sp. YC2-6 TaxID=2799498 RepID=UPI001F48CAC6|nr:phage virion morphogenesis protein [Antrihabitans sp. YC2-6]
MRITDGQDIPRMLDQIGADVKDLRGAMQDVGESAKLFFGGQVFASRGGVIGEPWQRLSPDYAAWKAKKYPGRPVLIRRGLMQRSFHYRSTPMSVTISNSAPYFKYHQSDEERSVIPRRVMLKMTSQFHDDVVGIIANSLIRRIKSRIV